MEMNCFHPFTFFNLSRRSVAVISLQLEGSGVREPAWSVQLGLTE